MKRKPGALFPIELAILSGAISLLRSGAAEFYGYAIARQLADAQDDRRLTAYGTLYRALDRLEKAGMLTSRWEDPGIAAAEQRPLRRLYQITAAGEAAANAAQPAAAATPATKRKQGLAPS